MRLNAIPEPFRQTLITLRYREYRPLSELLCEAIKLPGVVLSNRMTLLSEGVAQEQLSVETPVRLYYERDGNRTAKLKRPYRRVGNLVSAVSYVEAFLYPPLLDRQRLNQWAGSVHTIFSDGQAALPPEIEYLRPYLGSDHRFDPARFIAAREVWQIESIVQRTIEQRSMYF